MLIQVIRLVTFSRGKAITAIHGTIVTRLEGDFARSATLCADAIIHLALTSGGILAVVTAGLASLRFVYKAFGCIKFLLTSCEHELSATIFANKGFVFVHGFSSL